MSEYIGRRIVPVHGGVWNGSKSYEELTIVLHEDSGDSYISRRAVPAGTAITDETYWMLHSLYSQQIADAVAQMEETESKLTERVEEAEDLTNSNKNTLNSRMDSLETRLDANVTASTDEDADYAAEVVDARVSAGDTVYSNLGAHLRAVEVGTEIESLDGQKVIFPDTSMKEFFNLAVAKNSDCFEYSYTAENDTLRLACVKDYTGDYILFNPVMTARQYARLRRMGIKILLKLVSRDVSNSNKAFKIGFWPGKVSDPDTIAKGVLFQGMYTHVFADGGESLEEIVAIDSMNLDYDEELECYVRDDKPVNFQILLYANNPVAGDEITVSGFGGLIYGAGKDSVESALIQNYFFSKLRSLEDWSENATQSIESLEDEDALLWNGIRNDGQGIEFAPIGIFGVGSSYCELAEDEYGDLAYRVDFIDDNPMYQMPLEGYLVDSCREIIVELTARRLSENGVLRVQLYDRSCGMSHTFNGYTHTLTDNYRRYQFKVQRKNAGITTLGIGAYTKADMSVQFKNVRIFIPSEVSKQIPVPQKYYCGYPDDIDFSSLDAVNLDSPLMVGIGEKAPTDDLYLDTVEIYSTKQRTQTFYIGCIDQYGLLQTLSSFSIGVRKGRNLLKFDDAQVPVPAGYGVFAKWSTEMAVYSGAPDWNIINLISNEDNYYEDDNGYNGYPLVESSYMVPMRYTLTEKVLPIQLAEMQENIAEIESETGTLAERVSFLEADASPSSSALIAPDGVKYYLSINSDGSFSSIRSIPNRVVVFGNSLTLGFGTFGMAASSSDKDYFHYVKQFLLEKNEALVMERYGASTWEGYTDSESRLNYLNSLINSYIDGTEDLIIIQLSDNVNTDEKRATFPEDAETMITRFRTACPKARIVWIAAWYSNTANYATIETACNKLGVDIADIRDIATVAENKSAIGNTYTKDDGTVVEITSSGVASHPGDLGMERIAERVISVLESYM